MDIEPPEISREGSPDMHMSGGCIPEKFANFSGTIG
jgi:hypothetical protein